MSAPMAEHTIIAALVVIAPDRAEAHRHAVAALPRPHGVSQIESWWIAEDDRADGSDNDSAVFVTPGRQEHAAHVLQVLGLTPRCNLQTPDYADAARTWDVGPSIDATNDQVPSGAVYADALRIVLSAADAWSENETVRDALALLHGDVAGALHLNDDDDA